MAIESITNLLMKHTKMTEAQLRSVLNSSADSGHTVATVLEQTKDSTADELLSHLAKILEIDYMKEIPVNDIPVDLVRNLPLKYAQENAILPYREDFDKIQLITSNPFNSQVIEDLRVLYGKPIHLLFSSSNKIQDAINKVYEKSTAAFDGLEEIDEEEYDLDEPIVDLLEAGDDDAPVIKLVNTLLFRAVKEKASDIHIEPYERDLVVRFRIDGVLYDIYKPPKKFQNAITSRIKVMGNLNIAEKRLPQDGRIPLKLAGKDIDVRLNTVPTAHGERLVMRLQDRSNVILELEQLGFPRDTLEVMERLLAKTHGIILVTGPTGSGKSTTLYASIMKINSVEKNIITVEDPVENRIQGIGQIQVNSKIGLTFASGLRAILRQDPDVIMIGEIRDFETAEIAINASLTGHLVLSTIHTNDAAGAVPRLIDMGCEPFLISSSILGILAQRLARVLCPHCKAPYEPTDEDLKTLELGRDQIVGAKFSKAVGCSQCNQKGYIGRTVISELLVVTDEVRRLILLKQDGGIIKKQAIQEGMRTIRGDGIRKVLNGITTIEELLGNSQTDD
ncbi:MAG: type II secretion system ATPase GspE [Bdellovibrionales bacterium]|nr:type II secretion system ATPase GspE [Bdellovibrionales bacterium]